MRMPEFGGLSDARASGVNVICKGTVNGLKDGERSEVNRAERSRGCSVCVPPYRV